MPDYYNIITDIDPAIVANIANVLEIRAADPNYMLTIVDRGADALAAALKAEARQRVEEKRFFGHISYTSLIAHKPDPASNHTTAEAA